MVSIALLVSAMYTAAAGKGTAKALPVPTEAQACVECHTKLSPGIVADWKASKHAGMKVTCVSCHGKDHQSVSDGALAQVPTPETCAKCHVSQVDMFKSGKHALAWAAMKAMPTIHHQPESLIDGMKGCGGCHKIGLKSAAEVKTLRMSGEVFGTASCDSCHTRHTFSVAEAKAPEACETCHMGFDHPQWEMYSGSKHGVRHAMKAQKILPEATSAPTCQTCHMPDGEHGVKTAWGFLAVRLPLPEDKTWAADRTVILQALGVLDPAGQPTARLELVKGASVARLSQEEWQTQRNEMQEICASCHSADFARGELQKGDALIKDADHLMADAIRTVAGLYKDGVIAKPADYASPFPDLLTFHDAPTVIEQKLFVMFLEHRMRTFQGAFHNSPDYAIWYGWSEMRRDLTEIRELAAQMRAERSAPKQGLSGTR